MYLKYLGLTEPPFSITPDPRFVYLGRQHEDALAHLRYGLGQEGSGGFVQLTGEVGTGKTTLSRLLLENLPEDTEAALILNPLLEPLELLCTLCEELGIRTTRARGSVKALTDRLNRHLLDAHAAGRTVVVLIDEAQNLSPAALEQIRLLTNLETSRKKLLQIILIGQPELRDVLDRADLRQLAQRITARFHLAPLDAQDTGHYVAHRLQVAGATRNPFTQRAISRLHQLTGGVPRLINVVADRALLAAYARETRTIDVALVKHAYSEVSGRPAPSASRTSRVLGMAAMVLVMVAGAWWARGQLEMPAEPPAAAMQVATAPDPVLPERPPAQEPVVPESEPADRPRALGALSLDAGMQALLVARAVDEVEASGCEWTLAPGVFCLEQRGRWADLDNLGRPVLASVPQGWAVVRVLPDEKLSWLGSEGEIEVSRARFEAAWSGRFVDVWRMPGYVTDLLREGDRGPAVLWIKVAAVHADPAYAGDSADPYFGPALTRWTQAFQQASGVRSDGLIGRETLQHLSRYAAPSATFVRNAD